LRGGIKRRRGNAVFKKPQRDPMGSKTGRMQLMVESVEAPPVEVVVVNGEGKQTGTAEEVVAGKSCTFCYMSFASAEKGVVQTPIGLQHGRCAKAWAKQVSVGTTVRPALSAGRA